MKKDRQSWKETPLASWWELLFEAETKIVEGSELRPQTQIQKQHRTEKQSWLEEVKQK